MVIRTFFARILVFMTFVFVVAILIVVSVNYQSRQSYWALTEAHQQSLQWQEAREAIVQLSELEEPIPEDRLQMLASRPLPLDCCKFERALVLDRLKSFGTGIGADRYRVSAAWEQLLLAQRLALSEKRRDLTAEIAIRNWMVPSLSALALAMVLLLSWTVIKVRVIAPTEKLSNYVNRLLRGRQSQALNMSSAPSELAALYEAFDLTIGDYRGQLSARRERTLEMSGESDLLEMQVQSLVEMSERPAFVLDVTGAIRTWNRRMISLTGVSKNQALRGLFSIEYLDVRSQGIFDVAMQTARSGKLPDEFGCSLLLNGGREVPITLQLSPQIEPGLGVNRVLGVVSEERTEKRDASTPEAETHLRVEESPLIKYVGALERGLSTSIQEGDVLTQQELERRQKAFVHAMRWLTKNHDNQVDVSIDTTELVTHVVSLWAPKCQELDIVLETELRADGAMSKIKAGALVEILNALLGNACDALRNMGAGERKISITTECRDTFLVVRVVDSGPGVDNFVQNHAFDPFFTTKADLGSLGLGLSHARYVTEMAGGRLDLSNPRLGQGAEVTLRLPATALGIS